MTEMNMWYGTVDSRLEQGEATGFQLKKGDVISVVAYGYVKFGPRDNQWADPMSDIPPYGARPSKTITPGLSAMIGDDKTLYPIGTGILSWSIPTDGELIFLFLDEPGHYQDNSGSFHVTVQKQLKSTWNFRLMANSEEGVQTTITIREGQELTVTATGETSYDGGSHKIGPEGNPSHKDPKAILPEANVGALLMKVGDNPLQVIGTGISGSASHDGKISFYYNDVPNQYSNNSGEISINITIG